LSGWTCQNARKSASNERDLSAWREKAFENTKRKGNLKGGRGGVRDERAEKDAKYWGVGEGPEGSLC